MTRVLQHVACFALCALLNLPSMTVRADEGDRLFTLRVLPLLKDKCFGCHASDPDDLKGEYAVDSREAVLKRDESGPSNR